MEFLLAIILAAVVQEDADNASAELDFAELFRENYPRAYNYLRYRVGSPQDVEDLISVVFEKAYTHRQRFDPTRGTFATWLLRIAHNTLANYYRTHERRLGWEITGELADDLATSETSPETQIIQREAISQLLQGLARLSERDQEVISLKFGSRLSHQEIGQIMNLKEKTVSVVLLRAMRRLQKQLEETAS
ncbi:MAG: sigma-70 family RNA polymerase sigma factor [Anaerolineae bacterium]|nr:sigma-70 family RNA polymerase sigma factor [Anaerolineae bacterium]